MSENSAIKSIWQISREYAGFAEAGGVKNVVCSLAEGYAQYGISSYIFLPFYGFLKHNPAVLNSQFVCSGTIQIGWSIWMVSFYSLVKNGVKIILIDTPPFSEKQGVYTYTEKDKDRFPSQNRGEGYKDATELNIIHQKAVLLFGKLTNQIPDIIQCHDSCTALISGMIKSKLSLAEKFQNTQVLVVIHNAGSGYHHQIDSLQQAKELTDISEKILENSLINEKVEPYLVAAQTAALCTVSPWYAEDLLSKEHNLDTGGLSIEFSKRNIKIDGITNGIDYEKYDPENCAKSLLPFSFSPSTGDCAGKIKCREYLFDQIKSQLLPAGLELFGNLITYDDSIYFTYHGRIASQKGLDILAAAMPDVLLKIPQARFIIVGQGEQKLESLLIELSQKFNGKVIFIRGYERAFVRLVVASGDFIVLPSRFEPCGLEDYIAQIYGTIPVAHAVGGLKKIQQGKTGYLYKGKNEIEALVEILKTVSRIFNNFSEQQKKMVIRAAKMVKEEKNWNVVLKTQYIPYLQKLIKKE